MKREQNRIHQKLDAQKAPINKEAFWERMQQSEDFPRKEASNKRRGLWYGLLLCLLIGSGALAWLFWPAADGMEPKAAEVVKSPTKVEQIVQTAPEPKAAKTAESPTNSPTESSQESTIPAPQLQKTGTNRQDTDLQLSTAPGQTNTLSPNIQKNTGNISREKSGNIPVHPEKQNFNAPAADSIQQPKAPRAQLLLKSPKAPPGLAQSAQKNTNSPHLPPSQLQNLKKEAALPHQRKTLALSTLLDNGDIPLLQHQLTPPENMSHLKLISRQKTRNWAIALSAGLGYTWHQLSADSTTELDDFNQRTANSKTLESYALDLELSRRLKGKWMLAFNLRYRQDHQRFKTSYLSNETYTRNADPSNGYFSKTAERITHEHFHRYRSLQWGLSLGRKARLGNFQLEYAAGLGTQLFFRASGKLLDASNTLISLNEDESYENSWRPYYFGQVRLVRPLGHRLALIGDLSMQSPLRWTRKEAAVQHKAIPLIAKLGFRYSL